MGDCSEQVDVKIEVPHVRQIHHWDCGLACLQMVLRHFSISSNDFKEVCKELQFGDSVWTLDLAYMLKHYGLNHYFYTITLGVDKGFSSKSFYRDRFSSDELRVNRLFEKSEQEGVHVEKRSVTLDEILAHLKQRKLVIALIDWSKLNCKWCVRQRCLTSMSCLGKCVNIYQGHFILVCGYNMKEKLIYYKNPSYGIELCCCSMRTFDVARKSYGTDEDIIFVFDQENQRENRNR